MAVGLTPEKLTCFVVKYPIMTSKAAIQYPFCCLKHIIKMLAGRCLRILPIFAVIRNIFALIGTPANQSIILDNKAVCDTNAGPPSYTGKELLETDEGS